VLPSIISGGRYHLGTIWAENSPPFCYFPLLASSCSSDGKVIFKLPFLVKSFASNLPELKSNGYLDFTLVLPTFEYINWPIFFYKSAMLVYSSTPSTGMMVLLNPKSQNLIEQSSYIRMLAGLMSLCITLAEWIKLIVHNILYNINFMSLVPHFIPPSPSRVDFKSTDIYSITTNRHFIYAISFKAFSGINMSYNNGV